MTYGSEQAPVTPEPAPRPPLAPTPTWVRPLLVVSFLIVAWAFYEGQKPKYR